MQFLLFLAPPSSAPMLQPGDDLAVVKLRKREFSVGARGHLGLRFATLDALCVEGILEEVGSGGESVEALGFFRVPCEAHFRNRRLSKQGHHHHHQRSSLAYVLSRRWIIM